MGLSYIFSLLQLLLWVVFAVHQQLFQLISSSTHPETSVSRCVGLSFIVAGTVAGIDVSSFVSGVMGRAATD